MQLLLDAVVIVRAGALLVGGIALRGDAAAARCSGDRRAGALLVGGIALRGDAPAAGCGGDRRVGALLVGGIVLMGDGTAAGYMVIVVLVLSSLEASLHLAMVILHAAGVIVVLVPSSLEASLC